MGEVSVGDRLLDERGIPCTVTGVSSVYLDHDVFDVMFEASGNDKALRSGLDVVTPRGVIVSIGLGGDATLPLNQLVGKELELRGMPTELALLPFIESAFNPQAVSGAKAAGMWQFMPATGKDFELKQNMFRDDRRDVLASTRAALDYLKKLHGMFGDWQLALAAYNAGPGAVDAAVKAHGDAWLAHMPKETQDYVAKARKLTGDYAATEGAADPAVVDAEVAS